MEKRRGVDLKPVLPCVHAGGLGLGLRCPVWLPLCDLLPADQMHGGEGAITKREKRKNPFLVYLHLNQI